MPRIPQAPVTTGIPVVRQDVLGPLRTAQGVARLGEQALGIIAEVERQKVEERRAQDFADGIAAISIGIAEASEEAKRTNDYRGMESLFAQSAQERVAQALESVQDEKVRRELESRSTLAIAEEQIRVSRDAYGLEIDAGKASLRAKLEDMASAIARTSGEKRDAMRHNAELMIGMAPYETEADKIALRESLDEKVDLVDAIRQLREDPEALAVRLVDPAELANLDPVRRETLHAQALEAARINRSQVEAEIARRRQEMSDAAARRFALRSVSGEPYPEEERLRDLELMEATAVRASVEFYNRQGVVRSDPMHMASLRELAVSGDLTYEQVQARRPYLSDTDYATMLSTAGSTQAKTQLALVEEMNKRIEGRFSTTIFDPTATAAQINAVRDDALDEFEAWRADNPEASKAQMIEAVEKIVAKRQISQLIPQLRPPYGLGRAPRNQKDLEEATKNLKRAVAAGEIGGNRWLLEQRRIRLWQIRLEEGSVAAAVTISE